MNAQLEQVDLPDFGMPDAIPEIPPEVYRSRVERLRARAGERIQARRRLMRDALGIDLHPAVLPFSNIPAYLPPFLRRPDHVMTMAG